MRDVAEIEISRAVNDLGYEVTGVIGIDPDADEAVITVVLQKVKKTNCVNITVNIPAGCTPESTGREIAKAIAEYQGGVEYR